MSPANDPHNHTCHPRQRYKGPHESNPVGAFAFYRALYQTDLNYYAVLRICSVGVVSRIPLASAIER
jgi:hypothetical protein